MKEIMQFENPAWLKRMENGTIGETRTKAFLLDRFWVLERSVDIEGADFLIQQRILRENLYDRSPPRFGIVQVKYYESAATTQYVPIEYFYDQEKNRIRNEFFLIVHTGKEDNWNMFYIIAEELNNSFEKKIYKGKNVVSLPGKKILLDKYKVVSKSCCLDRIENSLKLSDFQENRGYLLQYNFIRESKIDQKAIIPIYKEAIPNPYADIESQFETIKTSAQQSIYKLEDIITLYKNIIREPDPWNAIEVFDDLDSELGYSSFGLECYRELRWKDVCSDETFIDAVKYHKIVYGLLKNDGLLDYLIVNKSKYFETVSNTIHNNYWNEDDLIKITLVFSSNNMFVIENIESTKTKSEKEKYKIKTSREMIYFWEKNKLLIFAYPLRYGKYIDGKTLAITEDEVWNDEKLFFYNQPFEEIIQHKYSKQIEELWNDYEFIKSIV